MKKIKNIKLALQTETIKQLDSTQLSEVVGAISMSCLGGCTVGCGYTSPPTCPSNYTACLCVSRMATNC